MGLVTPRGTNCFNSPFCSTPTLLSQSKNSLLCQLMSQFFLKNVIESPTQICYFFQPRPPFLVTDKWKLAHFAVYFPIGRFDSSMHAHYLQNPPALECLFREIFTSSPLTIRAKAPGYCNRKLQGISPCFSDTPNFDPAKMCREIAKKRGIVI